MDQGQQNVNLRYATPVVISDGHIIMLNDQGVPTLLFFQIRDQHEGHVHADVVSAVRLNSIDDLKNLSKGIADTIKKHKDREP